jgi:hypothetical protein
MGLLEGTGRTEMLWARRRCLASRTQSNVSSQVKSWKSSLNHPIHERGCFFFCAGWLRDTVHLHHCPSLSVPGPDHCVRTTDADHAQGK